MTDLPEPLTSPDCDLRGLEWMPLYGDRLFESDTWLMASPEGRGAALALWWAAWKQRPAGSLPDQDRALAQLAGYGMAVSAWCAVRDEAMRGWVKCRDGRLYHPMVCALAREAWERRLKERTRKAALRARIAAREGGGTGAGVPRDIPPDNAGDTPGTGPGPSAPVRADRTGEDRTGQDRTGESPSLCSSAPAPRPSAPRPSAPRRPSECGTRLAEDWRPDAEARLFATALGLDAEATAADFRRYWCARAGAGARKMSWSLTWQSWCTREARERAERRGGRPDPRAPDPRAWALPEAGDLLGQALCSPPIHSPSIRALKHHTPPPGHAQGT